MQSNSKPIVWVVVGLVVLGVIYYLYAHKSAPVADNSIPLPATAVTQSSQEKVSTLPSGAAVSDAALAQDAAAMGGYMSAMDSDSAAINAGMTDKQVSQ